MRVHEIPIVNKCGYKRDNNNNIRGTWDVGVS